MYEHWASNTGHHASSTEHRTLNAPFKPCQHAGTAKQYCRRQGFSLLMIRFAACGPCRDYGTSELVCFFFTIFCSCLDGEFRFSLSKGTHSRALQDFPHFPAGEVLDDRVIRKVASDWIAGKSFAGVLDSSTLFDELAMAKDSAFLWAHAQNVGFCEEGLAEMPAVNWVASGVGCGF